MALMSMYVTWDGELWDGASELALGESWPVVILIQHHYLYCGWVLKSLSAGRQRKGFQLHTVTERDSCYYNPRHFICASIFFLHPDSRGDCSI